MTTLSQLQGYLDGYLNFDKKLDITKIDPYMTNGLMVRGKEEVKKIGFGVSASLALFEKARSTQCDALIVHHSFNFPSSNRYDTIFQNRIGYLIKNSISLFGFHFLLDAHPEVGHNAQIIKKIGAEPRKPYLHRGNPWGWTGEFVQAVNFSDIEGTLKPYLSKTSTIYNFGKKMIKKVVAVSGMGSPVPSDMHDLLEEGIDLFITGEVHEWNRELFREAKINFIAGGHYHTEVFGLQALMEKIREKFQKVEVVWLDLVNEI